MPEDRPRVQEPRGSTSNGKTFLDAEGYSDQNGFDVTTQTRKVDNLMVHLRLVLYNTSTRSAMDVREFAPRDEEFRTEGELLWPDFELARYEGCNPAFIPSEDVVEGGRATQEGLVCEQ